jgi:hypothetical protein
LLLISFILPATAIKHASGSIDNNNSGSSSVGSTESNNTGNGQSINNAGSAQESNNIGNGQQGSNNGTTGMGIRESSNNETAADFANNILAVHNVERAAVGVQPLVWSDKLAADAKTWADHMVVTHEFIHCGTMPGCDTHGEGENMQGQLFHLPNALSTAKLLDGGVNEKNYYQQWATNSLPKTAKWTGWIPGHYNQMIWNTTKEVGCATGFTPVQAHSPFDDNLRVVYLDCRYTPPGNFPHQKPY